jgi:hypothetical protein
MDDPYLYTDWEAEDLSRQVAVDSLYRRAREMVADAGGGDSMRSV